MLEARLRFLLWEIPGAIASHGAVLLLLFFFPAAVWHRVLYRAISNGTLAEETRQAEGRI